MPSSDGISLVLAALVFHKPIDVICLLNLELLNICVLSADAAILQYDGHADRAKTAKTMQQDDTVIVGLGPRFWVHHIVETLFHRTKPGELLFGSLSLAPHQLRHSCPSCDVLGTAVTLKVANKRGRSLSDKSVARYEKRCRLLQLANRLPCALKIASIEATKELPPLLIYLLTVNQ
jgi:hypothetical protein